LFDAYHVPKPLSQQLLPFGRSGDGLEELTFGVEQFSALSVRGGQSVWDGSQLASSSRVLCVLARLRFRSIMFSSFGWARFRTVRVCRADSPRVPRGQSACSPQTVRYSGSLLEVLLALSDSPRPKPDGPPYPCGQSAVRSRTVRVARADSPPLLAGRSARAWLLCFLVRFLFVRIDSPVSPYWASGPLALYIVTLA
jgi:hypothetical protein